MQSLQSHRAGLGARPTTTHNRSCLLVPCAYKQNKNNQQQNQQRGPGFLGYPSLPPMDPNEVQAPLPVNTPQQQPGQWQADPYLQPALNPNQVPGPQQGYMTNPNQYQPRSNPNRKQQQPYNANQPPLDLGFWTMPPSQQNGGYGRSNLRNNNGANKFQGFDASTDALLQELDDFSFKGGAYGDWYGDYQDEEIEVQEDTSPKYVNKKRVLVNKEIEAATVRVQDAQKQDVGVMTFEEARQLATADGLDVVLINEAGDPPVVRLVQFGKYKFEQERAAKQKQKSSKGIETKEVRLRPVTEPHDYEVKIKQARGFLAKGSKVKLTMQFNGRELRFKDQGKEMMLKLIEDLSSTSKMDAPLSLRPKTFSVTLSPK